MTRTYVIDGAEVTGLDSFWRVIGAAVNGPEGYFGRNLDSFADCLSGGFGTPDDRDFVIEWRDHELSRRALGREETVRRLRLRLERAHPLNRAAIQAELAQAEAGRGATVFDWLVDIMAERAPGALRLR
ncbi:barstar family protein [Streptomyces lunaelactis]|uniref:barstar family protein n=1 Tax=Streptomyces lunaelactis TaxID=1535768 RepID=UPI001584EE50|nr:barstar family protein [Streptomyces lunaelactis]NUK07885.1 barstar family protein [Streptomyces lunaelactis]NUK33913.1 barstar family protein [Streptomyces lunaelactis]NUK45279.1 barstar family protein [Streptomyces lunaelactis]NUK49779.1 barstar family protein [Streptomyces lunaelactis]NUK58562.1 barstar family protein [Streptomyces lunaelactis]